MQVVCGIIISYLGEFSMYKKTLVILKPDAVERHLMGKIVSYFEDAGLKIHGAKMLKAKRETIELHYQEHKEKPFFNSVVDFLMSGPIVALVVGGFEAIAKVRKICGSTEPASAEVASIRGRWAHLSYESSGDRVLKNLVHASDCDVSAECEIRLWFDDDEIFDYAMPDDKCLNFYSS